MTFWKLVEKSVEKKAWFSNQVLSVSKTKKSTLFTDSKLYSITIYTYYLILFYIRRAILTRRATFFFFRLKLKKESGLTA
jgi:hypothetical protein